jgi:dTDP-4-dehydrorhamnose reductase
MDEVIRRGAEHVTAAARRHDARLIHLSTDVIFDGQHAPYHEEDPPRPCTPMGGPRLPPNSSVARTPIPSSCARL